MNNEIDLVAVGTEIARLFGMGGVLMVMVVEAIKMLTIKVEPVKKRLKPIAYFYIVRAIVFVLALIVAFVNKRDILMEMGYPGFAPEVGYAAYAFLFVMVETGGDAVWDKFRVALGLKETKKPKEVHNA